MLKKIVKAPYVKGDPLQLVDFLALKSGLSKAKLKEAMVKGAVWIKGKKRKGNFRVRRATAELRNGDIVELYYDEKILSVPEIEITELQRGRGWIAYFKPAGVLSQGTKYGDHISLLRHVEKKERESFLIHRLDREASGVMIVATNKKMATDLSRQFAENKTVKIYRAIIEGEIESLGKKGTIDLPLEGKEARTDYQILKTKGNRALVEILLHTGRTHQIRKHFSMKNCPLYGDVEYGPYRGQHYDLPLVAHSLTFFDLGTKKPVTVEVSSDHALIEIPD